MIGFLQGKVLSSDGQETILLTPSGIGYQIKTHGLFSQGQVLKFYISTIIKENSQELFGFSSMREKKVFELILEVKGVGPKGAYNLVHTLGFQGFVDAICYENKKALQKAPSIGSRVAAQILLDLKGKIDKMAIYMEATPSPTSTVQKNLLDDALLACEQLGLGPEQIAPMAQKLLQENDITHSEQLVQLILKGA